MTLGHCPRLRSARLPRRRLLVGAGAAALVSLAGCKSVPLDAPEKTIPVRGPAGMLAVRDGGSGSRLPVLFVHGFAGSSRQWTDALRHVRETRRAVAFDLRGHGASDIPAAQAAYTIEAMAGDIAAVADTLQLNRFVIVGHSLGASVAMAYAGRNPARAAGLLLVGPAGRMPAETSLPIMQALRDSYEKPMNEYWTQLLAGARIENEKPLRAAMQRVPRETGLALTGAVFSFDPVLALQNYTGPVEILDTPLGDGPNALYRQLPTAKRLVMSGVSHWPHLDAPAEFERVLDDFVASVQ